MSDEDITIIGQRIGYSDSLAEVFGITRLDRRRHLYAQGKTGSGKSTLLISMIAQDLARGEGVCFIDPLGHNAETVLSYVPKGRTEEVRYLNVADLERPVGLNILSGYDPAQRHRLTAAAVDAFASVWDLSLARTPQLLDVLGYTVAALSEVPEATLLIIPRFLTDSGYRKRKVDAYVSDPAVRAFWITFGMRSARERNDMCGSVLNKANELCREPVLRNILGQSPNKLDIREIVERRGILIVNLGKSEIGKEYARLIGAFLISQISLAAASRMQALARCVADEPERALAAFPDFYVYVDEFQDLATAKFDDALSQSRNGRVSFALFNQFQAQLGFEVQGALFGNVGSLISFEVGANDAEQLSREFDHHFSPQELTGLRQYEIALKLPKRVGNPPYPFKAYTLSVEPEGYGARRRESIINYSRERFGRPRERVERSVARVLGSLSLDQPARPARVPKAPTLESAQPQQAKTVKRCEHCNEAGFLELRQKESGELVVHRCPHTPKLIAVIEKRLMASRVLEERKTPFYNSQKAVDKQQRYF